MRLSRSRRLAERLVSRRVADRTRQLDAEVGALGVDPFGYDPKMVPIVAQPIAWLYDHYFRVQTEGVQNVPDGRVLLVSNHSGQLPFDGLMIGASLIFERNPPRVVRSMVERWVPRLPFVSVFMARTGQIVGTPDNCRRLLNRDEAILVFPEGVRGISKTYDKRYQLERFGTGFLRLALETNTPIVPVGVVGAEEQAPSFFNVKPLARLLDIPAFPVTPTFPALGPLGLLPLPARYFIQFGEPMTFDEHPDEEDRVIRGHVEEVREAIQKLLARGLERRTSRYF